MEQPKRRQTTLHTDSVRVVHEFGNAECWGDTDIEFRGDLETFQVEMHHITGKDRDGYGAADEAEIALSVEEAREVYLLLPVWLEERA